MSNNDDLVSWLRVQLDEDEHTAVQAAASLANHHHVPVDAYKYEAAAQRWESKRWLFHRKVVAGDGRPEWRDDGPLIADDLWVEVAEHIAGHDPARVLREVEAKRRIMDLCEHTLEYEDYGCPVAESVLRNLALPYADRPGYREGWRP